MTSIFKRNKYLIVIIAMIFVFAISNTYAWFVSQVYGGPNEIIIGELGIKAIFNLDNDDELLGPGLDVSKTATFTNTGTVPLCAKLDLETEILVYRDTSGELLSDPSGIPAPVGDNYVSVNVDIDNLVAEGVIELDDNSFIFAWLYDKNNPNNLYLFADPKVAVDMDFIVSISSATPNQYTDAKITFVSTAKAAQLQPGAMLDELGIDADSLGYVSELQTNHNYSAQHPTVKAWADEQLGR